MLNLAPESDLAVRDAVQDHLEGNPCLRLDGPAAFETRNNRYRLIDGVLFDARDAAMCGAELVGWLLESPGDATVESAWYPGARGVFIHNQRGARIIVTSVTTRFGLGFETPEAMGAMDQGGGSTEDQPASEPWASLLPNWVYGSSVVVAEVPPPIPPPAPVATPARNAVPKRAVHAPPRPLPAAPRPPGLAAKPPARRTAVPPPLPVLPPSAVAAPMRSDAAPATNLPFLLMRQAKTTSMTAPR